MSDDMQKTAWITGASRGLGIELVRQFLAGGYQIRATSRTVSAELESLMESSNGRIRHLPLRLDLPDALERKDARTFFGPREPGDVLVMNAAMAIEGLATDFDSAEVSRLFQVNVLANMQLGRLFLRNRLAQAKPGSVTLISSVCAHTGYSGLPAYSASKGAMEAWIRSVAREWGRKNIRANSIAAGFMETDMTRGLDEAQRARIFRRTPMGKATSPESVAATAVFLASDGAASITGETVRVE